jgi:hypothetical protein
MNREDDSKTSYKPVLCVSKTVTSAPRGTYLRKGVTATDWEKLV